MARRTRSALGVLLLLAGAAGARAETLRAEALAAIVDSDAPRELRDGALSFEIDEATRIAVALRNTRRVEIAYRSDGLFQLHAATLAPGSLDHGPASLLLTSPVGPGRGSLPVDLRRTARFSRESPLYLSLEGTGRFAIEALEVTALEPGADPAREQDAAFFWLPERLRHSTINFVTPAWWSFRRDRRLPDVLGVPLLAAALGLAVLARWRPGARAALPALGLALALLYQLHFLVRLAPALHTQLAIGSAEKIRRNHESPEFGALAAAAREALPPDAVVAILARRRDWFGPQTLCFELAPRPCGIAVPGEQRYPGIAGITHVDASEVDAVVAYNSPHPLPDGFEVTRRIHRNAWIARRR